MRTYQRLAFARGGSELSARNPAYPHNFLVTNSATGVLKIGSTGVRYNDLPEVSKTPQTFVPPTSTIPIDTEEVEPTVELQTAWPPARKTKSRKKKVVADDVEESLD